MVPKAILLSCGPKTKRIVWVQINAQSGDWFEVSETATGQSYFVHKSNLFDTCEEALEYLKIELS